MTMFRQGSAWRRPMVQGVIFATLLWLVAFACYVSPNAARGQESAAEMLFLTLCSTVGLTLSITVLSAFRALRHRSRPEAVASGSVTVAAALLTHAAFDTASFEIIMRPTIVLGPRAHVSSEGLLFLNNVLLLAPVHLTFAVTVLLGLSLQTIGERERRLAAALSAAQEARLAALRLQINPHFLFNSLNALTALVAAGRKADAEAIVARLAAFFRASLDRDPTAMVPLREEFDILASYLEIEEVRLGDRLKVEIGLPRDLAALPVPHFLLQPLVENAVKHGVAPCADPVTVRIAAARDGDVLVLEVSDDGGRRGDAVAGRAIGLLTGAGVGLDNVRARIGALYGESAGLDLLRCDAGFMARVRIPIGDQCRQAA